MTNRWIRSAFASLWVAALAVCEGGSRAETSPPEESAELAALARKVKTFRAVPFARQAGEKVLTPEQSLTCKQIRGVDLDPDPPVLAAPANPYDPRMTDSFPPGQAPYVAPGIKPFRLRHFQCEFNYGGWHNYAMADYAAAHGFTILSPYVRKVEEGAHLPPGTQWLAWGGFIDWQKWLPKHGIPDGRYDLLAGMDLVRLHVESGVFRRAVPPVTLKDTAAYLMIDMEHSVLPPEKLRGQDWYPKAASAAERAAFEKRYYDGYAQTYVTAVNAARQEGWTNLSVYGWAPFGRTWGGLEQAEVEPGADFAWNAFGRQIYQAVDLVNNSVYCFYWSPQNVAYTLANIDSNVARANSMPVAKPIRPYFWTLLHGGGGGWRWWQGQPVANEEERAMIAMAFFTGIDGFDTWNWSGTGNHHVPPELPSPGKTTDYFASGADLMLKDGFTLQAEGAADGSTPETFRRYDVVHVLRVEDGLVRFQKIRHGKPNHGVGEEFPVYALLAEPFTAHLRPKSEPVAAMIEAMALVKPLESMLRHGEVKIDVPAREQFRQTLPLVRRVKLGRTHVLVTYDPQVVYGGSPREITLENFDGCPGLTLRLPADSETRIFVLREE